MYITLVGRIPQRQVCDVNDQVYRPQLVPSSEFGGRGFNGARQKLKTHGSGHGGLQAQS